MAQSPLSAIDWLSDTVGAPVPDLSTTIEPDVSGNASTEPITVRPIGAVTLDSIGLWPGARLDLPADLWGTSAAEDIASLFRRDRSGSLPALREFVHQLVLAEFEAPATIDTEGALLAARVDTLLNLGALDEAAALLEKSGTPTAPLFRRAFDVALLTGQEDAACEELSANPSIAPSFQARIFCLARSGDWSAAALTLETGEALGYLEPDIADLMAHFLEPELAEIEDTPPIPERPTPLLFRVAEAIGEPIPTATLPRAFAHSDLRPTVGWKAQIEAAERLARAGALPDDRLFELYRERSPSASGGVWDRVAAIQAMDTVLEEGSNEALLLALRPAWEAMSSAGLALPFARTYGADLARPDLTGSDRALALRIALLSPAADVVASNTSVTEFPIARALLNGTLDQVDASTPVEDAIRRAYLTRGVPERFRSLVDDGRPGEALLQATLLFDGGAGGDLPKLTEALRYFRSMGLDGLAEEASLQLLLIGAG